MKTKESASLTATIKRNRLKALFLRFAVYLAAFITVGTAVTLVGYILIMGVPNLNAEMFSLEYNSENQSLMPALINTVTVTLMSLLIAVPLGIFSAVYLVEYAGRGNRLVSLIRLTAETLTGIPSIVYGLFGYLMFNKALGWGYCLMSGILTLSVMILPVIIRTTEEALKSVPDSYREGSFGLGAGKLRTVFRVVFPSAVPGILAGVVLSVGRIVGETAALIFTAGTVPQTASLSSSGETLSVHMYRLWNEGLNTEDSYATAVVLLVTVIGLNALSAYIAKKISKGKADGKDKNRKS